MDLQAAAEDPDPPKLPESVFQEVRDTATKYNLTDTQLRHLAIICYREQRDSDAGVRACASQMCNYYEAFQKKNFRNVYECVFGSGWYWNRETNERWLENHPTVPQNVIEAVDDVIRKAKRTLPEYVVEYDRLKDVVSIINDGRTYTMERDAEYVLNRRNYHKDKTKIRNQNADPGEYYTFYCFPDGPDGVADAFGYISKSIPKKEETSTMTIPEKACSWGEGIAADQSHGYSQADRWGPNFDCSSLIIEAYIKAGVPIDKTKVYYTGNMQGLKDYGFVDVTDKVDLNTGKGMFRGDILYYHISGTNGHTAMYCGNGTIVHARGQSYGSSKTGDQGTEIAVTSYTRSKWQYVLRYKGTATPNSTVNLTETLTSSIALTTVTLLEIKQGSAGSIVCIMQGILDAMGYRLEIDGDFGSNTAYALRAFQKAAGLTVDGICGAKTWKRLKEGLIT